MSLPSRTLFRPLLGSSRSNSTTFARHQSPSLKATTSSLCQSFPKSFQNHISKMSFHFGSSEYAQCFPDLPTPDTKAIKASALEYLNTFDPNSWFTDPVRFKMFHMGRNPFSILYFTIIYSMKFIFTPSHVE